MRFVDLKSNLTRRVNNNNIIQNRGCHLLGRDLYLSDILDTSNS